MALELIITKAGGKKVPRTVQPGAAIQLDPGDVVTLAAPGQAAGMHFVHSGNNLVVTYGEGSVEVTNFYVINPPAQFSPPTGDSVTPQSNLDQVNAQMPPPGNSLQADKLVGITTGDDTSFAEDQSGAASSGTGTGGGQGGGSDQPVPGSASETPPGGPADGFADVGGAPSEFSITAAQAREGAAMVFTIRRTGGLGPSSVNFDTGVGSASAADFTAVHATVSFAAGETVKTVTVQTLPDALAEGNETFTATLSNATNAGKITDPASVDGTIVNNTPPTANPDAVAVNEDATTANLAATLIGNDTDPEVATGDVLRIAAVNTAGTSGTVTFDATGQTLTYTANNATTQNALGAGQVMTDTFTYTLTDAGNATSNPATVTVTVTGVNDAPVAQGSRTVTVLEDTGNTPLGITAPTDVDILPAPDVLTITVTGIATPGQGTVFLADGVTPVNVSQILSSAQLTGLLFRPAPDAEGAAGAFSYTVTDGQGGSASQTVTLQITRIDDAPVASNLNAAETYTEDTPHPLTLIVVTDVDSPNISATLTLSNPAAGALSTGTSGLVTSTYNAATGTWTASGAIADVNNVLAAVDFNPALNFSGNFSIATSVSDGTTTLTGTKTVTGIAVNDAPVATNLNTAEAYTEDTPLNLVDIVVSDVDSANVTASLTLSNVAAGSLSTATSGAVTSTYNAGTGVWSASGATASVNALLAGVTFNPALDFNGNFTIATSVSDGLASVSGSKTVTGTAVNDAPTATNLGAPESYTEDTPLNLTNIVVSDVDSASVTATLTLSNVAAGTLSTGTSGAVTSTYNAGTGAWSASGAIADVNTLLAGVNFTPTLNFNANFTIATSVSDGVAPAVTGSKAMTGAAVNDAPTATNLGATDAYTEDTPLNLTDIVVSDVDSANVGATLTLSDPLAGALSTAASGAVTSTYSAATGVWTAVGALADVNTLLAGVTFTPAANYNTNISIATAVSDGVAAPITGSKALNGISQNDAPVNTVPGAQTVNEDTNLTINGISIADVDATGAMQVNLSANNGALLTLSGTAGLLFTLGTGTGDSAMTFTGTLAAVNSALAGLSFTGAANFSGAATITLTSDDQGSSGTLAGPTTLDTDVISVTVNAVNDAPVNTVPAGPPLTVNEDTNLTFAGNVSIADADGAGTLERVIFSATNGTLTLSQTTGLTFSTGDGTGDATMTFTGTVTNINAALNNAFFLGNLDFSGAAVITLNTNDQGNTGIGGALFDNDTINVTINAVNDAPVGVNKDVTDVYLNDGTNYIVKDLTDIQVSDVDSTNVTVTLTVDNLAASLSTGTFGTVTSTYVAGTGVWTASGIIADVNAALAAVTFTPPPSPASGGTNPLPGNDVHIAVNIDDPEAGGVTTGTKLLTSVINFPPTATNLSAGETYTEDTPLNLTDIVINDPNFVPTPPATGPSLTFESATLTLSNPLAGSLSTGTSGAVTSTYNAGTGVWTAAGNMNDVNTLLAGLTFNPAADFSGTFNISTSVSDGIAAPITGTKVMTGNAVNDAPINTVPATQNISEDTVFAIPGISVNDVDAAASPITMTLAMTNGTISVNTAVGGGVPAGSITGNNTATITLTGTQVAIDATLANATGVTYTPTLNFSGSAQLTVTTSDGGATGSGGVRTDVDQVTINVAAVNDAPTATNLTAAETYTEDTPLNLINIVAADVDSPSVTATLTLSNPLAGALTTATSGAVTSTYSAATGVWSASGAIADVNTLLAGVTFNPALNFNANFSIATSVSDGVAPAVTGSKAMTGTAVNDAPIATNLSAGETYTEETPVALTAIAVSDVDSASVTATLTLSNVAAGALSTGTSGAVTSTYTPGTGVWSASGAIADVNTLLAGVTFTPALNFSSNFTIATSVSDGVAPAVTGSKAVTGVAVNDAPTATNLGAAETYTEDTPLNLTDIVISDVDSANVTATLTLSNPLAGALSTATSGAVTSTYSAASGVWTASGALASVNTLLAGVTFNPALNFNGNFSIATSVSDGVAAAITGSKNVTGTAVNDAPTASNLSAPETYTEDTPLNLINIVTADVDSPSVTATLTLSNTAAGSLSTATSGAVTSTYVAGTGVWTASGAIADVNVLLAGVTFTPALDFSSNFTIATSVSDGVAPAVTGSKAMTGVPVNDAPTATNLNAAETYTEDTPLNLTDIVAADVDGGTITATLTLSNTAAGSLSTATSGAVTSTYNAGTGVWTASGALANVNTLLAGVTFNPTLNFNASFSIATSISDGIAPAITGTKAVTGTAVNDAPTASNLSTGEAYTEDTPRNLTDIVVNDVDSAAITATLTLSDPLAGALSTATSGAVTSTYVAGTGVWTASGAIADVNALLAGVTFNPALNYNANFTIATSVSDGAALPITGSKAMTGTAVNDAPTASNLSAPETYTEDTPLNLTDIVAADVDNATVTATLTLSNTAAGSLSTGTFGTVTSTYVAGTGVWTAAGAIADVNSALAAVSFTPTLNFNSNFTIATSVSDGVAPAVTGSKVITGTAVNDTPVNTVPGAQVVNEDTNLTFAGNLSIADGDGAGTTEQVTFSTTNGALTLSQTTGLAFSVGDGTADATMTFTGTVTNVNAALNNAFFRGTQDFSGAAVITLNTNDQGNTGTGGALIDNDTINVTVSAVNDAPVNTVPAAQSATEDTAKVISGISVSDVDAGATAITTTLTVTNGTISVNAAAAGGVGAGNITGNGTTTITLTGTQTAINNTLADAVGVTYNPTLNFNGAATLTVATSDGGATGSGGILNDSDPVTINVAAVNDAPANTVPGAQVVNEDTNLTFAGNLSIADVDGAGTIERVTFSTTNGTLTLSQTTGLTFSAGDGTADTTMTFTGTVTNINAALNNAFFRGTQDFAGAAVITLNTDDQGNTGTGGALVDNDTINVTVNPVQDAPTATNLSTSEGYQQNITLNLTDIVVTDPDAGDTITATLTLSDIAAGTLTTGTFGGVTSTFAGVVWTASGSVTDVNAALAAVSFVPALNYNAIFNILTHVDDGIAPAITGTKSMSTNQPPTATNLSTADPYTEDTAKNLTDIVVSNAEGTDTITATLTLSNTAAGSLSTATSGAVTSTFVGGVWTASGALADVNTLLAGVTFNPALNFNSTFTIATSVTDGFSAPITGTKNMPGTAVNDAPLATNMSAIETYIEDTPLNLTNIVVTDPDVGDTITATLTLSNTAAGALSTATSGAVTSTYVPGTGVWTASGALADVNTLLAGVTFNPAANFNGNFSIATSVSDGVAAAVTGSKAMTGTPVNDVPLATNLNAAEAYTEDTPLNLTDIVVTDNDLGNITATLTLSNTAAGALSTATSGSVTSTYVPGTGVWTASGALADVNTLLAGVTFNPTLNFNSSFTIATSVSDGVAPALTGTKNVTGTAVNDAPTATNLSQGETYTEDTTLNLTNIVVTDVDNATVTATLTLSNTAAGSLTTGTFGTVTSTYVAGTGVWTASGATADVNSALAAVSFAPALNFNSAFTIATSVSDGIAPAVTGSKAMTGTAVNDAPTATNLSAAEAYIEDTPLNLTDIVASDVDSPNVTATLTLSNTAAGSLSTATSNAVTSTYVAGTGVWTASGALADVNVLLAGVTFNPTLNFNSNFTITTSISDGVAAAVTGSKAVTGTAVNDAPTATNLSAAETYTEDTGLNLTDIVVSDVDSANVTATLTLSNTAAGSLSTATSGAVTSTFGAGVWSASGALANVNILLAGVTFNPAANFNSSFSIATSVSDGVAAAITGTKTINGTPVNDAPSATNLGSAETYTEDTPLNLIDIVVSDVDSPNVTATLTLSNTAAGSLSTATSGAVTSTYVAGTGVWTASGALGDVNALLAGVTFNPALNFNSSFTIATSVSDAIAAPTTGSKSMTGTAVNDAPTATNLSAAETYTEDTPLNLNDIVVSDVDSTNATVTLTLSNTAAGSLSTATSGSVTSTYVAGTGVWTASGAIANVNILLAGVTFNPALNFNGNFTIATSVTDGLSPAVTGSKAVTGTAVNDAPTATNLSGSETYTEDTARNLTDIVVSDVDNATVTATLTLSDTLAGALSTATSGAVTSTYVAGTGVWTASGAIGDVNALLAGVTFNPALNYNANFTIATSVSDGVAPAVTGSKVMTGTPVNDAPTATNLSAAEAYTEDTPVNLTNIVASDVDSAAVTATLTLSTAAAGALSTGTSGSVTSTYNAGTGIWTANGAIADVNTLLAGVTFNPAANFNANFSITTSISDGVAPAITGSKAFTGTAVNDAPSATNLNAADAFQQNITANLTDIVVTDVDNATVTATLTLSDIAAGSLSTGTSGAVTSTFVGGVWTASGATANVNTLLAAVTFTPALDYTTNFTIATSATDGLLSVTGSKTMTFTVNAPPSATNLGAAEAYTEDTPLNLTNIVVTDADSANVTATLTLSDPLAGALTTATSGSVTSTYSAGSGVWTASGAIADVNSLLAGVTFNPAANYNAPFNIATSVSDGIAAPVTGSKAMTGTPVNDAPTATNLSTGQSYTEDTPLDLADIAVSDVDSATVTATLTLSNTAAGSLSTATSGAVTSTYVAGTGVWTASGALADVNTLLAGVTFNPALNFSSNFTIATSVSDGVAAAITGSKAMTGIPQNDAPTATNLNQGETYTEDTPLNLADIVVTDVDSASVTATLTLSNAAAGSLSTATSGAVTSTYVAGTGVWTASGALANVNVLLSGVTFNPALNFNGNFSIASQVSDGVAAPINGSKAITGLPVNDAPAISGLGGTVTFTLGGSAVTVDNSFSINDPDSANLASATVTISTGFLAGDALAFTSQFGITGSQTGNVLTLGGSATVANYVTVLGSITFSTTAAAGARVLNYVVNDGTASSSGTAANVNVAAGSGGPKLLITLTGLDGNEGFKINGVTDGAPFDQAGFSVSTGGDANGDGYADILISAPLGLHALSPAGQAYVVFGNTTSFLQSNVANGSTGFNLGSLSGSASPFLGFKINGPSPGSAAISTVSGGDDINGDGYADLLTGSNTFQGTGGTPQRGYIVFGDSPTDLAALATSAAQPGSATVVNGSNGYDLTNANGTDAVLLRGNAALTTKPMSIAPAGDLDGDGRSELVLGQQDANANAGQVYLVYGDTGANLQALTSAGSGLNNSASVLKFNGGAGTNTGQAVASAGDINNDGIPDLIFGAPGASGKGAAYVVYGGSRAALGANLTNATGSGFDLTTLHGGTNGAAGQPMGFTIIGQTNTTIPNAQAGYSVASAGDFNGDGIDDLIVGAPTLTSNPVSTGLSYIVYGRPGGFSADVDLGTLDASTTGFAIIGGRHSPGAFSGRSVSGVGDANGDGYADVLIGATGTQEAYLIYGAPNTVWAGRITSNIFGAGLNAFKVASLGAIDPTSAGQGVADTPLLDGINGTLLKGAAGTNIGFALDGAGDINGDGFSDLLVGADQSNSNGQVYVIFGGNLSAKSTAGVGSSGAPSTASADNTAVVGGLGNDFLSSGSHVGVSLLGGAHQPGGHDTFIVNGNERRVDGDGYGWLQFSTNNQGLDFTSIANGKYTGVDHIDLAGTGTNSVTLNVRDLLEMSDQNHQLFIKGGSGESDTVHALLLSGDTQNGTTQGWVQNGTVVDSGVTYSNYEYHGAGGASPAQTAAHLLVDANITLQFT